MKADDLAAGFNQSQECLSREILIFIQYICKYLIRVLIQLIREVSFHDSICMAIVLQQKRRIIYLRISEWISSEEGSQIFFINLTSSITNCLKNAFDFICFESSCCHVPQFRCVFSLFPIKSIYSGLLLEQSIAKNIISKFANFREYGHSDSIIKDNIENYRN